MRIDFGTFAADGSPGDLSNLVTDPKLVMYIDVAPGPYKGVMASPMGQ
jgi:hypothetical protein